MKRASDVGVRVMGEAFFILGVEYSGIVDDLLVNPTLVPGGESRGLRYRLQVSLEIGGGIEDGTPIEVRGFHGRVAGKEHFGAGWWILIGSTNRWNGEIPGL